MTEPNPLMFAIEAYGAARHAEGKAQTASEKARARCERAVAELSVNEAFARFARKPPELTLEEIAQEADKHGWVLRFGYKGTHGFTYGFNGEPWGARLNDRTEYGWTILEAARKALAAAMEATR